jgi:bifunctional N-acetylglucosamine-1-phosphate-uridyltransferase/glucosamine-1-phosphate-acetyltransferase GlmU-like protein
MNSDLPKVLHRIGGAPLFVHALESGRELAPERTILITGHEAEQVEAIARDLDDDIICIRQDEQLGTGHAVLQAREALKDFDGDVVVLFGDTPFLRPETLEALVDARKTADVVVLGFHAAADARYGRFITDGTRLTKITEWKDANEAERAIRRARIRLANEGHFELVLGMQMTRFIPAYRLPDKELEGILREVEEHAEAIAETGERKPPRPAAKKTQPRKPAARKTKKR